MSNRHSKRPKPAKRRRAKRERPIPVAKMLPGRLLRIHPDPRTPHYIVEVRVTRTRKQMRDQTRRFGNEQDKRTQGCVVSHFSTVTRPCRDVVREGRIVARMFLNVKDIRNAPADLLAHECTHAGMAWARLKKADLCVMPGEEVLCHAVGDMTQQLVNKLHGMGML